MLADGCFPDGKFALAPFRTSELSGVELVFFVVFDVNPCDLDLDSFDVDAFDLDAFDLDAFNLDAFDVGAFDFDAFDVDACDFDVSDVDGCNVGCPVGGFDADAAVSEASASTFCFLSPVLLGPAAGTFFFSDVFVGPNDVRVNFSTVGLVSDKITALYDS